MYRKILIACNGSPESRTALDECIRLELGPNAEIHILGVVNSPVPPPVLLTDFATVVDIPADEYAVEREKMEHELTAAQTTLSAAGLISVVTHLDEGEPVPVIKEWVEKLGIELLIVGHSRARPWALRWWRGSTDAALVEKVHCSILVAAELQI